MNLSSIREDFMSLDEDGQRAFIASYRSFRQTFLEAVLPKKRKKSTKPKQTSFEALGLTEDEEKIAKALGLTPQQVLAMRK